MIISDKRSLFISVDSDDEDASPSPSKKTKDLWTETIDPWTEAMEKFLAEHNMPKEWAIETNRERIGQGKEATVYRLGDGRLLKIYNRSYNLLAGVDPRYFRDEITELRGEALLRGKKLPHVLQIDGSYVFGEDNHVLFALFQHKGEKLEERMQRRTHLKDRVSFASQIAEGIAALHKEGFVYLDLSMRNIVVDKEGQITLIDPGLVRKVPTEEELKKEPEKALGLRLGVGSAPEQSDMEKYGLEVDLWHLGLLIYKLFHGKDALTLGEIRELQEAAIKPPKVEIAFDEDCPKEIQDVIQGLLQIDPKKRLPAQVVFERLEKYRASQQHADADSDMADAALLS